MMDNGKAKVENDGGKAFKKPAEIWMGSVVGDGLARLDTILAAQPVRGVNLRVFARRYCLDRIVMVGESVLARGRSDHVWCYLLPSDQESGSGLLEVLEGTDEYIVGFDDWMLTMIREHFLVEWTLYCRKLAWPHGREPGSPLHPIRRLVREDAAFIHANSDYGQFTGIPYIMERIDHGAGGGIEGADGELAAWALTHDDGAIGFLHVMEPYRRLGYAESLTWWMIKEVRAKADIPFIHVEPTNEKSLALARKAGFMDAGVAWWAKIRRGVAQSDAMCGTIGSR